ncbi:hypothetical protein ACFL3V_04820 [Nanoarchaeota archaeon]
MAEDEYLRIYSWDIGQKLGRSLITDDDQDINSAVHGARCYLNGVDENDMALRDCHEPRTAVQAYETLTSTADQEVKPLTDGEDLDDCMAEFRQGLESVLP